MAEAWARHLQGDRIEPHSAGVATQPLNPNAVKVMAEVGIDISGHRSKHVDELKHIDFDYVVTVCDNAREACPIFPGSARVMHKSFDDPPRLARDARTEEETLSHYRRVRDEIRHYIETLPEVLPPKVNASDLATKAEKKAGREKRVP
jgi:arsenate reductase